MLVGTHDGAVQKYLFNVGILRQRGKDGLPYRVVCPAGEASIHVVPGTKFRRQDGPWIAGTRHPQHGFDALAIIRAAAPSVRGLAARQGLDALLLVVAA